MATEQINPSTLRVLFNPATQKVLMSAAQCEHCSEPPQTVKCETFDVATCEGLGNCVRGDNARDKPLSYGIGWNQVSIMTPGRAMPFGPGGDSDYYKEIPAVQCWWSEIVHDDFGYYDTYSQDGCAGDVLGRTYWHVRVCQVHVAANGCVVTVKLGRQGYYNGYIIIFNRSYSFSANGACFPYGQIIENDRDCEGIVRHGYGTAKLTEVT